MCDKVDIIDSKNIFDPITSKAKELNKDLETLVTRLYQMRDIDYDENKIEYLYQMAEKAIE